MAMSSLAGMQLGAGRFRVSRVFFRAGRVASWDSEGVLVEWPGSVRGSGAGGVVGVHAGTRDSKHVFGLQTASYMTLTTEGMKSDVL